MKLMGATSMYGNEVSVMIGYGERFFFQGEEQPEPERLLYFEMPGLKTMVDTSIRAWLAIRNREFFKRSNVARFGDRSWRYATPFDILEVDNYQSYAYGLSNYFTVEELEPFYSEVLPSMSERFREISETPERLERVEKIDLHVDYMRRTAYPAYYVPYKLDRVKQEIEEAIDRETFAKIKARPFTISKAVASAGELRTARMQQELAIWIAEQLVSQKLPPDKFLAAVRKVGKRSELRDACHWDHRFWTKVSPYLELPSNMKGEIDITNAIEVTVPANWDVVNGKRVGKVVIGRTALQVYDPEKQKTTFVRGERKLKFKVKKAGGSLKFDQCTLVVETGGMGSILVEVERIDTICSLDPHAALKLADDKKLPGDHPIFAAAQRATDDYKQARVLADLLIEEVIGIDADIARAMARAQSRGRR